MKKLLLIVGFLLSSAAFGQTFKTNNLEVGGTLKVNPFAAGTLSSDASGNIGVTNNHLVIWTVAPSTASVAEKARADFVGNGTSDDVAINAAAVAAGATGTGIAYAKIIILPGIYHLAAPIFFSGTGLIVDAEGTRIIGAGGGQDAVQIGGGNHSYYRLGEINSSGAGAAIHSMGGLTEGLISWQALMGTAQQGRGLYIDATATGAAQSVNTIEGHHILGFDKGIAFESTSNIDTFRINVADFIQQCNVAIYVNGSVGHKINANVWNVNVDSSWDSSAIAIQTNADYDVWNAILGDLTGSGINFQLDSGASYNTLNLTPMPLAEATNGLIDNSGNATNRIGVGMTTALILASAGAGNKLVKWSGSTIGTLDNSGLSWASANTLGTLVQRDGSTGGFYAGDINTSGQLTSTVSTGSAPFVVASTTQVANLNAATAGTATIAITAGNANAIATLQNSTNLNYYPVFTTSTSNSYQQLNLNSGITFNPFSASISATNLNASGQLISTVATGTAPLAVSSTTNVANLNASSLSGATFASPGTIGGTTPGMGKFTTTIANTAAIIGAPALLNGELGNLVNVGSTSAGEITSVRYGDTGGNFGAGFIGILNPNAAYGSHTAVASGNVLTSISAQGDDGVSNFKTLGARIKFLVDGTVSSGIVPGRIELNTVNSSGTETTALKLDSSQKAIFSGAIGFTNILMSPTAPTISSGFGTSPSIVANNGTAAFTVNVGTGGSASSGIITMPAATTGWACSVSPNAAPQAAAVTYSSPTSTTSITLTNYTLTTGAALSWTASTILSVRCTGY